RWRHAQLAPGERRHHVEMLLDRLQDGVRVQLDVPHHLGEHIPLDLSERQKNMFVCQQCVLTPTRLLNRPIDDSLRGFANLARRDVEVFYAPRSRRRPEGSTSKTWASAQPWLDGHRSSAVSC